MRIFNIEITRFPETSIQALSLILRNFVEAFEGTSTRLQAHFLAGTCKCCTQIMVILNLNVCMHVYVCVRVCVQAQTYIHIPSFLSLKGTVVLNCAAVNALASASFPI